MPHHVSHVTCHMSRVMCHVSGVRCQVSGVMCHFFLLLFFRQSVEASRWRVCYQRGLPRLVYYAKRRQKKLIQQKAQNFLGRNTFLNPPDLKIRREKYYYFLGYPCGTLLTWCGEYQNTLHFLERKEN